MINQYAFILTLFNWKKFSDATGNVYEVVSIQPYKGKEGVLPKGVTVTLRILSDSTDYGEDKETGEPRPNNVGQNFEATILTGSSRLDNISVGDKVSLSEFDVEHSYVIKLNLILRFKGIQKVSTPTVAPQTQQSQSNGGLNAKSLRPQA